MARTLGTSAKRAACAPVYPDSSVNLEYTPLVSATCAVLHAWACRVVETARHTPTLPWRLLLPGPET